MGFQIMVPFTAEEDVLMEELVKIHGQKWRRISKHFPGRTIGSLRNRWIRRKNGAKAAKDGKTKNRCMLCGKVKRGHICKLKNESMLPTDNLNNLPLATATLEEPPPLITLPIDQLPLAAAALEAPPPLITLPIDRLSPTSSLCTEQFPMRAPDTVKIVLSPPGKKSN